MSFVVSKYAPLAKTKIIYKTIFYQLGQDM